MSLLSSWSNWSNEGDRVDLLRSGEETRAFWCRTLQSRSQGRGCSYLITDDTRFVRRDSGCNGSVTTARLSLSGSDWEDQAWL